MFEIYENIFNTFWDLSFTNEKSREKFGIYVSYHTCCNYWKDIYGEVLYNERQKQVRFTKNCLLFSENKVK